MTNRLKGKPLPRRPVAEGRPDQGKGADTDKVLCGLRPCLRLHLLSPLEHQELLSKLCMRKSNSSAPFT